MPPRPAGNPALADYRQWHTGVKKPKSAPMNLPEELPCKYEAHHLIGIEQAGPFPVMKRAERFGYDINRKSNGAWFPGYGGDYGVSLQQGQQYARYYAGLPLHKGGHGGKQVLYTERVTQHLQAIQDRFDAGELSDCDLCGEIGKIEEKLRQELKDRNIWLNANDIHPNVVGQKQTCNLT